MTTEDLEFKRVYRLDSRNLSLGVYADNGCFIGLREKFGDRFLFYESVTVRRYSATRFVVPDSISIQVTLGTKNFSTGKLIRYRGGAWYELDGDQPLKNVMPVSITNRYLIDFLEYVENEIVIDAR